MFTPLPTSMPKLEDAVRQMDEVAVQTPPPMMEIGQRLRLAYARARSNAYSDLSQSEIRKLPFAYLVGDEPSLQDIDGELTRLYWDEYLPEALLSSPRRAKRWLSPLFFTYCEHFNPTSSVFRDFANKLVRAIGSAQGLFAEKLQDLQRRHGFFIPSEVPARLATHFFVNQSKSIDQLMADALLWPGFVESGLGEATFRAGLSLPGQHYTEAQTIYRVMDWNKRLPASVVKTDIRVPFADALLRHWGRQKPVDSIKSVMIDFFVRVYGDPRFEGHRQYQWHGVSPQALATFKNWLTGDTLRGFMKLLQRTADDIWMHRQKFWMAYYEKGCIDEAWLALGQDALWEAKRLLVDEKGMGYGYLEGGAASNQSVMFLKIGDLVFTEWSHNGSLRAYREGYLDTPKLYEKSYHGADLRAAQSMDFHDGANLNPGLVHSHSDKGTWQRKARDFIRSNTGVTMSDWEIV
jgi:hypothetical protein